MVVAIFIVTQVSHTYLNKMEMGMPLSILLIDVFYFPFLIKLLLGNQAAYSQVVGRELPMLCRSPTAS